MNVSLTHPIESHLPNAETLEFRVFDNTRSLLPVVPAWQALADRCENGFNFFCTPHWVMNWLEAFPEKRLRLVTLWRGGSMVLMAPMADCTIAGSIRQWCCASFPEAGYGGMLVSPDERADELSQMLLAFLTAQREADILVFPSVPENTQWLPTTQHVKTPAAGAYATMVDVRKDDRVAKSKSSKRNFKRKRSRLARDGELTLELV
ncbi:MAG: hypothetical protein AAF141_16265, partial [Pseudomonadota bacterium]